MCLDAVSKFDTAINAIKCLEMNVPFEDSPMNKAFVHEIGNLTGTYIKFKDDHKKAQREGRKKVQKKTRSANVSAVVGRPNSLFLAYR